MVLSVLIGSTLMGAPGAFIAVPFAAMLQVIFEEVVLPWRLARIGGLESASPDQPVPRSKRSARLTHPSRFGRWRAHPTLRPGSHVT